MEFYQAGLISKDLRPRSSEAQIIIQHHEAWIARTFEGKWTFESAETIKNGAIAKPLKRNNL